MVAPARLAGIETLRRSSATRPRNRLGEGSPIGSIVGVCPRKHPDDAPIVSHGRYTASSSP
jgi:hypothetical protein